MDTWRLILLALVGAAAGWINVMAGGGSMLTVPVMIFLGLPGPVANGTNRVAIIAQNIVAVWRFFHSGFSDFRLSATLALAASVGAFAGAQVGVKLEGEWFNRVLAAIMLGVLILMATGRKSAPQNTHEGGARNLVLGHVLMVGAGFWGGFIQIGVGFLLMPILYRVMGLDLVRVNMHKVFIVLVFSFVALAVFASKIDIRWEMGAALALGNAVGGWLGARSSVQKGETLIKPALYMTLVVLVIKLLFFQ